MKKKLYVIPTIIIVVVLIVSLVTTIVIIKSNPSIPTSSSTTSLHTTSDITTSFTTSNIETSESTTISLTTKKEEIYNVYISISNGTYNGDKTIKENETKEISIVPNDGYMLPTSIYIDNAEYNYDISNSRIIISSPKGNVTIRVNCIAIPEEYEVKTTPKPTLDELKTLDYTKGNYVLACDYYGDQTVVMYDLDYYQNNLEECEIWTLEPNVIDPITGSRVTTRTCICAKLRYVDNYGLICLVGNSYGYVCLYSFPEGKLLKYYKMRQPNLHSCEILPNGTVISMGINDDNIRVFNPDDSNYTTYYHGALGHSVIYDSKTDQIYTAGGYYIRRWNILRDEKGNVSLELDKTFDLGYSGDPHDITFDPFDDNVIYVTDNNSQYKFFKDTFTIESVSSISQCKAYGYNCLGTLIYNYATYSYLTNSITAHYKGYKNNRTLTSSFREFYKTSPVNIDYMYKNENIEVL